MSESNMLLDKITAQLDELETSIVAIKASNVPALVDIAMNLESKLAIARDELDELRRSGFERSAETLQAMTSGLWQLGQAVAKLREAR